MTDPFGYLDVYDFIEGELSGSGPKVVLEVGAHMGQDTVRLAALPSVVVHAFEPDPRNQVPALPNVVFNRAAVGAAVGEAPFFQSDLRGDLEWTMSGSLRRPTGHLELYPDVEFMDRPILVPTTTLDVYVRERGLARVDLVWADVQGAEVDLIRGGQEALRRTRFLYTEHSATPLYEGQLPLAELIKLLPGRWRVLHDWPAPGEHYADAVLANEDPA